MSEYRPRPATGFVPAVALAMLGVSALGGCSTIHSHQGYIVDRALVATVSPGVDNRESVQRTLGRPSFAGEFDPNSTWYYVSRDTRQFSFGTPKPTKQLVLIVRFDPAGNVTSVDRTGLEKIARVIPSGDKTATRGRKSNFFQDVFGNIGAGGNTAAGGTADNPTAAVAGGRG